MFLAVLATFLVGIESRWPVVVVALLAGVCSGIRPVGIALLPATLLYAWTECDPPRLWKMGLLGCIGCAGLLLYMLFLHLDFQEPTAFAKTQRYWSIRPNTSIRQQLVRLMAGEPFWKNYLPGQYHWSKRNSSTAVINLQFANPILFMGTCVLTVYGYWKRILNRYEFWTAVFLLAIPYVTRGYLWALGSHGRFAIVVLPAYFVAGVILTRLPHWAPICFFLVSLSWAVSVVTLHGGGSSVY